MITARSYPVTAVRDKQIDVTFPVRMNGEKLNNTNSERITNGLTRSEVGVILGKDQMQPVGGNSGSFALRWSAGNKLYLVDFTNVEVKGKQAMLNETLRM